MDQLKNIIDLKEKKPKEYTLLSEREKNESMCQNSKW